MSTYREIGYSVLSIIQQSHDDSKITESQIFFFVKIVAAKLLYQRLKNQKTFSGASLKRVTASVSFSGNLKTAKIPSEILDLESDLGIVEVSVFSDCGDQFFIERGSASQAGQISKIQSLEEEKFYYRIGDEVILKGFNCVDIACISMVIRPSGFDLDCNIDAEIGLPLELEEALITRVLYICRFGLVLEPDRNNDGSDSGADAKNKTAISQTPISEQNTQQNAPEQ